MKAGNRKEAFDENFDMQIIKFSGRAQFTQRVKVGGTNKVKGHLTFMTCDEEGCLPPADVNFEIALKE